MARDKQPTRRQRTKGQRIKNALINLLLVIMLVIGLALVFNNQIKNFIIRWMGEDSKIVNVTREEILANDKKEADFNFDDVESVDLNLVLKSVSYKDQLYVVGGLAIPAVKMNLPIFKGVSNYTISAGAGTMKADQLMGEGNYALASHAMVDNKTLFGPINLLPQMDDVKEDIMIYVTDLEYVYEYKMTKNFIVHPSEAEVIDDVPDKRMITLVTCTPSGYERIIIQGELEKKVPVAEASPEAAAAFEMETFTII